MGDATDLTVVLELTRTSAPQDPYAFRFELDDLPARCNAMGPGLTRNMWSGAHKNNADFQAMNAIERAIISKQEDINRNKCLPGDPNASVVTHTIPPFETYLRQLDIYAEPSTY